MRGGLLDGQLLPLCGESYAPSYGRLQNHALARAACDTSSFDETHMKTFAASQDFHAGERGGGLCGCILQATLLKCCRCAV